MSEYDKWYKDKIQKELKSLKTKNKNLREELKIAHNFIEDIAKNDSCNSEYSPDCRTCCADTILTRSKYYKPEDKGNNEPPKARR